MGRGEGGGGGGGEGGRGGGEGGRGGPPARNQKKPQLVPFKVP